MVNVFPTVLYSCMIGMAFIALLDLFNRGKERQNLFLKGLLLLLVIHLAGELFIYSGAYVYAPEFAGLQFPFRILMGPALFFYAHATMSADKKIDKKYWLMALSGPVLVVIVMLPFLFMITPAEKLALASPATRDPELWRISILTCSIVTTLFIIYTAYFLMLAFQLHRAHNQQLMERFSDIEQRSVDWFKPILVIWGAVWCMFAIEFTLNALGWRWFGTGKLLPTLEVVALAMFIQKALSQKVLSHVDKGVPRAQGTRTALLSDEKMQSIAQKLRHAMQSEQLFLDESLSLKRLSEEVRESENHISETLSQHLNTNFFQFVNGFRIEAAKTALIESTKQVTIIAFEVGFNSKSTFNTAFKKIVGQSPSVYRKSFQENN